MLTCKIQSCYYDNCATLKFCKLSSHFASNCPTDEHEIFFYEVSIRVNIQKNFMFLSRTVLKKNAIISCKISKLFIRKIVHLWIFASYHRIFLKKLCDRWTWNFFCIKYPYELIYKKNFMFLGRTVSEKNAMLTCKISKLFIRTIVQLWNFASYHHIFLKNCAINEHEFFFA